MYGSEPYTRIGVVSNGYLVIGGGTADDLVFVPQTFPNAARPNNVLAPFWTDLNPAAAGAIRIGALTDGVDNWIVVDWAGVRNFSQRDDAHVRDLDQARHHRRRARRSRYSYGTNGAGDPGSGTNWGAENRDGTSGKNIPRSRPTAPSSPSSPRRRRRAGRSTIAYDASAKTARHVQLDRGDDVERHARHDAGRADVHGDEGP